MAESGSGESAGNGTGAASSATGATAASGTAESSSSTLNDRFLDSRAVAEEKVEYVSKRYCSDHVKVLSRV